MTEIWTLTGTLADFGLDPVTETTLITSHDPPVWVDSAGSRILVRDEQAFFFQDGTVTADLVVTEGHYKVRTSPRGLFHPFSFPSPQGGTHSLHDLYLAHVGVSAPGPLTPYVRGASAYELAVSNGFVGTEAEWLASLQSEDSPGRLTDHIESPTPHPAYDRDMPDLVVLFNNTVL